MGRSAERTAIDELLSSARAGRSGALLVRGDAGIGKSTLLAHARHEASASGFRVEASIGVESESQFAFAGLHQLFVPMLSSAGTLPHPQHNALGVAFGQQEGAAPDRFLIGLAALNLLAEVAEGGPLLCLIDDVQWLDEASVQVLAFVARRVSADRIALVFALRDPATRNTHAFVGIPELRLEGLDDVTARRLLAESAPTSLDEGIRDRILSEAQGNPLALLELPRSASTAWLAGSFELVGDPPVSHRVENSFHRRAEALPADTRQLLLVAAVDLTGDPALLWRAAAHLGISRDSAAPAEGADLAELDTQVRFRHPLVRSAIYRGAAPEERRRAHGALADATDPATDPDLRAWHRSQAVRGTDEDAAGALEASAERARARGGLAAAAVFMEQATLLSPDPAVRTSRALKAANTTFEAGAPESASGLLALAEFALLDSVQKARLELLRARIEFHLARGSEGPKILLQAASRLAPLDPALSRATYLHALDAAIVTGVSGHDAVRAARAARSAPAPPGTPSATDRLLDGLVMAFTQSYATALPELRRALKGFSESDAGARTVSDAEMCRWGWLASRTAMAMYDDDLALVLADRHTALARESGALTTLPAALLVHSVMLVLSGEPTRAAELTGTSALHRTLPLLHGQLIAAAWRGRSGEATEILSALVHEATGQGRETEVSLTQYAFAVLHNGDGDYPAAFAAAERAFDCEELRHSNLAHSELIEAACRSGHVDSATEALAQLEERANAGGTAWGLGLAARSRALVSFGPTAESHYREAIEHLGHSRMVAHLGRTHLVYGEWLRREGRRQDARDQLRTALQLLTSMGAEAFVARATRELRATGEHPRKRTSRPTNVLTDHELHIARLVGSGLTSREVGTQLFLSPRTIEAHLRSIFRKLGISSRRQLRDLSLD